MNIDLPNHSPLPSRDVLSQRQCLLIDGVFLLIALVAIPLALTYHSWSVPNQKAGLILLGVFLTMAVIGAGFLSVMLRLAALPEPSIFPYAARLGSRGGVLLVALGGGIFVLIASLRQREWLSDTAISANPYGLWIAILLSLIPIASGTALLSIFFSFILRRGAPVVPAVSDQPEQNKRKGGVIHIIAMALAALALLTPFVLPWIPKKAPAPVKVVMTVQPDNEKQPVKSNPVAEPVFYYSPPLGFDAAPPYRWEVLTRKIIEGVNGSLPSMMSPDGHYLAYVPTNASETLVVFDLNRFAVHSSYDQMDRLQEVAWSPESDQVFCLTGQERPFTSIIRLSQKKRLVLPLHQSATFPEGQPFWWEAFEVAFFPNSGPRLYLDLVEMRLRPLEESHRWRKLVEEPPSKTPPIPGLELTQSTRARLQVSPRITSYEAPGFQQSEYDLVWEPVFSVADKQFPHLCFLPHYKIQEGDRIASSPRSTILVRLRDNQAEVTYFTLKEHPGTFLEIAMPEGIDGKSMDDFQAKLDAFEVCGFVCAPRINPLTGQVVGTDREKVKALVRWMVWGESKATLWIEDQYDQIVTGDVVSDLHYWSGGRPASLSNPFPDRWWAEVSYPTDSGKSLQPSPGLRPLDRGSRANFLTNQGTLQFAELVYPIAMVSPAPVKSPSTPEPVPEGSPVAHAPTVAPPDTPEEKIRAFVREHYRKLSVKDFDGYLEDYTENVAYYRKAGTKNEYLRKAVFSLQSAKTLSAVPSEKIDVSEVVSDGVKTYSVSYEMTLTKEDSTGSRSSRLSQVVLSVFLLGETIRIVNESGPDADSTPP
jgi:hypothetical protein